MAGGYVKPDVAQGFRQAIKQTDDPIVQKIQEMMKANPNPTPVPGTIDPKEAALQKMRSQFPSGQKTVLPQAPNPQPMQQQSLLPARKLSPEDLDRQEAEHVQELMQQDPSLQVNPEKLQRLQKYFKPTE